VIGVASVALIVVLFATPWYATQTATDNGWLSLSILGPFALLVGLLGLGVWWFQASRRSPALPVCATLIELPLSFVLSVGLIVRVLIAHPAGVTSVRYGAYAGLVLALAVTAGSFWSSRTDGISPQDAPAEIETISLAELAGHGSPAPEP
jgi:O-antigen/teichoic acid export membrane protein